MKLSELKNIFSNTPNKFSRVQAPTPENVLARIISFYNSVQPTYIDKEGVEKSTLVYLQKLSGSSTLINDLIKLILNEEPYPHKRMAVKFLCKSQLPANYLDNIIYADDRSNLNLAEAAITLGELLSLPEKDREDFIDSPTSCTSDSEGRALVQLRHYWCSEGELRYYKKVFDYPTRNDEFQEAFKNASAVHELIEKNKDGHSKLENALKTKNIVRFEKILKHIYELSPSGSLFKNCIGKNFLRLVVGLNSLTILRWATEELKRLDPSLGLLRSQLSHWREWYNAPTVCIFDAIDAETENSVVEHLLNTMQSIEASGEEQKDSKKETLLASELRVFFGSRSDYVIRAFYTNVARAELLRKFAKIISLDVFNLRDRILAEPVWSIMTTAFQCIEIYLRDNPEDLKNELKMCAISTLRSSNPDRARFFLEKVVEADSSLIFLRQILGDEVLGWTPYASTGYEAVKEEFRAKLNNVMDNEEHRDFTLAQLNCKIYQAEQNVRARNYGFEESQRLLVSLKAQLQQLQASQATSTSSLSAGQPATEQDAQVVVAPAALTTALAQPNVEQGISH